jgi:cob(I)alamin adenosyltransferase
MKIYTKTGDDGGTALFAGPRVSKDHPRIEAYGAVDELNAVMGLVRSEPSLPGDIDALLAEIQHTLFAVGAELATPEPAKHGTSLVTAEQIEILERAIDEHESRLEPLRQFILPGGTPAAATLHVARTVCRRAERRIVTLGQVSDATISPLVIAWINRLGDLLFVLARSANSAAGVPDVAWQKPMSRK